MTNTLHEIDGLKNSSIRHNARLEQGVLRTWDGEMKDWKKQSLIVNMESKKRRRGDLLFLGGVEWRASVCHKSHYRVQAGMIAGWREAMCAPSVPPDRKGWKSVADPEPPQGGCRLPSVTECGKEATPCGVRSPSVRPEAASLNPAGEARNAAGAEGMEECR